MADEGKVKIEKFNGSNFGFWKMQIEDYLYQKDLYLPLGEKSKKPKDMTDDEWEILDRKALGTVRLSLAPSVAFNIKNEKTTASLMAALSRMYERPSASNKVNLMKKLFNIKMNEDGVVAEHLNDFNEIISQLESVTITFDEEVKALLLLSSLPDSWDGLVVAVSNSTGSGKLKMEDVVPYLFGEEGRRKSSVGSSGSAFRAEERGRRSTRNNNHNSNQNYRRKERGRSKSRRGRSKSRPRNKDKDDVCWDCGESGHYRRDCKAPKKHQENNRGGKDVAYVSDDDVADALILSLDSRTDSWVVDSGASFHATSRKDLLHNYVQGNFGKVYLGDDEACSITGKGDVQITQSDGSVLQLRDVRHVPNLTRNLISVGQLSDSGIVTSFTKDSWKMTKGALVMARGKKEGTLYVTSGTHSAIMVASSDLDASIWHHQLGHMSEKGIKVLESKGKLQIGKIS